MSDELSERVLALETALGHNPSAPAGDATESVDVSVDVDTGWMLIAGAMVFFMQCGFAMLSAGSIRSKNTKNILLKNLLDACFGSLGFYILGYGIAYGDKFHGDINKGNGFIGTEYFALFKMPQSQYAMWFFQFTFAATAATIVSGSVAERCKFEAYLAYAFFLTAWVYPVVVHWVWSGSGWASAARAPEVGPLLFKSGVIDFAGSGAVHLVGGMAGLIGAFILGPRHGRYSTNGKVVPMPGHSSSLCTLGTFILWFGWYGFNPGSTLALVGAGGLAAKVATITTLGAASGCFGGILATLLEEGYWDLNSGLNGCLMGLVSITGPCAVIEPWAAVAIGFIGGVLYTFGSSFIREVMKIDDPLDASTVHGIGGIWALIATGFLASTDNVRKVYGPDVGTGVIYGGNGSLLLAEVVYILAIIGWVSAMLFPFFVLLKAMGLFRVSLDEELQGLDVAKHGGTAYPPQEDTSVSGSMRSGSARFKIDEGSMMEEDGNK